MTTPLTEDQRADEQAWAAWRRARASQSRQGPPLADAPVGVGETFERERLWVGEPHPGQGRKGSNY